MGLLEVVAGDLLELGRAVAVDPVGPLHEALVQRRARTLQQPVVDAVPDQDVVEAVEVRLVSGGRTASASSSSRRGVDLVADEVVHELVHGRLAGSSGRPPTRGRSRHAALARGRRAGRSGAPGSSAAPSRARARSVRQTPSSSSRSPSSIIIDSSCSTKSGLPSAASTMRDARIVGDLRVAEEVVDDLRARRRPRADGARGGRTRSHAGRVSRRSGRAMQSRSAGASSAVVATWSTRSSSAGSAQWTSSSTSTSGRRRESVSTSLRAAQNTSDSGNCLLPRGRRRRRAARTRPPFPSPTRPASFARAAARSSPSSMPDACAQRFDERPERDPVAVGKAAAAEDERVLARRPRKRARRAVTCPRLRRP